MIDDKLKFGGDIQKLIHSISEHIDLGVYEDLIINWKSDIKVVSIMGP